jgi:uncharacterized protein (DUF58 family)
VLTANGRTLVAFAVVAAIAGFALGYPALIAVGFSFLLVLVVAAVWVSRRPRVDATRVVRPERVTVGGIAVSEMRIQNRSRRRTAGGTALEAFGDRRIPVSLPALEPGAGETVLQPLPTNRRGVFQVGPLLVSRSDPFGLLRIGQEQRDLATLYVHPRVIDLSPFPSGLHRDLDGPDLGDAPEGGITFQNLREYVEGDDLRLVHWRSYARTGTMMVRHNIDSHQPRSLIVIDTRAAVHDADSFEETIEAAASIMIASMLRRFPFRLETTCGVSISDTLSRAGALDKLAALDPSPQGSIERTVRRVGRDPGGASLAVVTGRCSSRDLAFLSPLRDRFDATTIARFGTQATGEIHLSAGAVLINAEHTAEFARAWNRRAR